MNWIASFALILLPWAASPVSAAGPLETHLACLGSLDSYSFGTGIIFKDIGNIAFLLAEDAPGFYLLNETGALLQRFPIPPPVEGVANYFFELPIRPPFCDRNVSYLIYSYIAGKPARTVVSISCEPTQGTPYERIDLGNIKPDPAALKSLTATLLGRIQTVHDDFTYYQKEYKKHHWPYRSAEDYLKQLDGCSRVQDESVQKAISLERAKF